MDSERWGGSNMKQDQYHQQYLALKMMVLFMAIGITALLLHQSAYPIHFLLTYSISKHPHSYNYQFPNGSSSPFHHFLTEYTPSQAKEEKELEKILNKAAMKDKKTVIITVVNEKWTEPHSLFDQFLESFRFGNGTQKLLKHLLVVAIDQTAYSRCLGMNLHCYALTTDGVNFSGEVEYLTESYMKMLWRRIDFLHTVLHMGYSFVFTDADVMWMRDPFPRFYSNGDLQISCDSYNSTNSTNNWVNGGFIYVKSNIRTIQFYKFWHTGNYYFPFHHDQGLFNLIRTNPVVISDIGLKIRFLDTHYFSGFCQPSKDLDNVITMHANCCIGLQHKIRQIQVVIDDWKRYMSLPSDRNLSTNSCFWTLPRLC